MLSTPPSYSPYREPKAEGRAALIAEEGRLRQAMLQASDEKRILLAEEQRLKTVEEECWAARWEEEARRVEEARRAHVEKVEDAERHHQAWVAEEAPMPCHVVVPCQAMPMPCRCRCHAT